MKLRFIKCRVQNAEWRRTISKEQPTTRLFQLGVRSEELGVADEEMSLSLLKNSTACGG